MIFVSLQNITIFPVKWDFYFINLLFTCIVYRF